MQQGDDDNNGLDHLARLDQKKKKHQWLAYLSLSLLRNLAEDAQVERKMKSRGIVAQLAAVLGQTCADQGSNAEGGDAIVVELQIL